MSRESLRQQARVASATALYEGASLVDLMSDTVAVSRGVGQPGPRERQDAEELVRLLTQDQDLDGDPPAA